MSEHRGRETVTYTVHVHEDADGSLWAEVEQLPGCFASGLTNAELFDSLREAIGLYLSDENLEVVARAIRPAADQVQTLDVELDKVS